MSNPLLRFEDGKISIGGKDVLASSANLSIAPTLQVERVYGDYDPAIAGAKTQFINFAPTQNLKGQLDISFYISADTFAIDGNPNTIDRMFDIADGMSEEAIHNNVVGRYRFDNMYLKSFGFEMKPFGIIQANASYDIYGSVTKIDSQRFQKSEVDFAHGLKSFGNIVASASTQDEFEIANLKYNIIVQRKTYNGIRLNENTAINHSANGAVPARVSVGLIEKEITVQSNDIIEKLNSYGDQQTSSYAFGLSDSSIDVFLLSMQDEKIARFSATGKIQTQSLSIQEGQHAAGSITIKEIVK